LFRRREQLKMMGRKIGIFGAELLMNAIEFVTFYVELSFDKNE
jgi:hypothetical protein